MTLIPTARADWRLQFIHTSEEAAAGITNGTEKPTATRIEIEAFIRKMDFDSSIDQLAEVSPIL